MPDNSVDGGEPESRPLALFLGREERFKHMSLSLGIHSVAGVLDRENDVGTGGHGVGRAGAGFFELHIPGFQNELSTRGHGIAGIDGQIHNDLVDLSRVHLNASQVGIERGHQFYVLANQVVKHLFNIGNQRVQIQYARLENLPSAEGQELARERSGSLAGFMNGFNVLAQRSAGFNMTQGEFAVAFDQRQ